MPMRGVVFDPGGAGRRRRARRCLAFALALSPLGAAPPSDPGPVRLRVGTSGDYAPFSLRGEQGRLQGFDVVIARRYAEDRGLRIEWVAFAWPALLDDLDAGRFDVAMSGVTVRPERSLAGRFSIPVTDSQALALVRDPEAFVDLDALRAPGVRIAVNAGGHLERVARAAFPAARIEAIPDNRAVPGALATGRADAVVTDSLEAPRWRQEHPQWQLRGPLSTDRKAYLLPAGAADRAADLDAWLMERERDGSLARWRTRHLGRSQAPRTADPLPALLAALDERLDLMPGVAEAKRARGVDVEAPQREARVLDSAERAVIEAARRGGRRPPPPAAVRAVFRAQIEAAKAVQRAVLAGPATPGPPPDLEGRLRPALLRIGERIARLLVTLPGGLDAPALRRRLESELSAPGLEAAHLDALARALAALSNAQEPSSSLRMRAPSASSAGAVRRRSGSG